MKYPVYSVRDVHVGFNQPMTDLNDNVAKRNFALAINNNDSMRFAPKDYDLYKIGDFDTDTGLLIPLPVPALVTSGFSVFGSEVS